MSLHTSRVVYGSSCLRLIAAAMGISGACFVATYVGSRIEACVFLGKSFEHLVDWLMVNCYLTIP